MSVDFYFYLSTVNTYREVIAESPHKYPESHALFEVLIYKNREGI